MPFNDLDGESTRELVPETWSEYFDALSRELLNAQVSIEITGAPGPPIMHVSQLALLALSYDPGDDRFEISAARGASQLPRVLRHKIDHPERVDVDNQTMLAPIKVGVDGPGNVRTVITIEREAEAID